MNKFPKSPVKAYTMMFVTVLLALLLSSFFNNDSKQSQTLPIAPINELELKTLDEIDPWRLYEKPFGKVIPLNGIWEITEGNMNDIPSEFNRKVQVPGLVTLANPSFEKVGMSGCYEAFWYRRVLSLENNHPRNVFLKLHKAKYGTKVYINTKVVGQKN